MPSLTIEEINLFSPFKTNVFVETGTNAGDTIKNVHQFFQKVYSIELDEKYYNNAKETFKHHNNISLLLGDSSKLLGDLCKSIDLPTFFWLDGHWSGGNTGRGEKDCPLLEELKEIVENLKSNCIIAIDDARLFGTNLDQDWSLITRENILTLVKDRLVSCKYFPSSIHKEDRMVLTLKSI